MPVRRFATATEQTQVVDECMEIILKTIEVDRDLLKGLEWCVNEITDNVLNHASSSDGGLVAMTTFRDSHRISLVVTDAGRGILASLREGYPQLRRDSDAIGEAMKAGVTRSSSVGQGNGLAGALGIATTSGGSFAVLSRRGGVRVLRPPDQTVHEHRAFGIEADEVYPGTFVGIELMTDGPFDLAAALPFAERIQWDYLDATYDTEGEVELDVAAEAAGFGSRSSGLSLRTKALNLLQSDPRCRLKVDWTGIATISSSFADEFIGKLFVHLGPIGFMSRVRLSNVDPFVQALVDRALMQRVAQTMADDRSVPERGT
jgi:anti-sigma regulatory factor (Ser/Thr protein kinase)